MPRRRTSRRRSTAQRRPDLPRLHRAAAAAAHLDTDRILERIDPAKDADGLHPTNLGKLVLNVNDEITSPLPCTPRAVIELLERNGFASPARTSWSSAAASRSAARSGCCSRAAPSTRR
jgi:hypothetical protein